MTNPPTKKKHGNALASPVAKRDKSLPNYHYNCRIRLGRKDVPVDVLFSASRVKHRGPLIVSGWSVRINGQDIIGWACPAAKGFLFNTQAK